MGALDEVAKLKAARRQELAAEAEARIRAAEEQQRQLFALLNSEIDRILGEHGLSFLAAHRVGEPSLWDRQTRAEVQFQIPGHVPVRMQLRYIEGGANQPAEFWRLTSQLIEGTNPWHVERRSTHENFADAMIDAEIEGWEPPATPAPELSPQTHEKASEVWPLMFAHAMPPRIAVDFVQDVAGERSHAVHAILLEAAAWLGNQRPTEGQPEGGSFADGDAGLIAGYVLNRDFDQARAARKHLAQRMGEWERQGDHQYAGPWFEWLKTASRTIDLCSAVAAEATAQGQGT